LQVATLGNPAKTLAPVEYPKRSTSQPALPLGFPVNQLPPLPHHASVASILSEQAESSMKTVQPIPTFSNKKPLAPRTLTKPSRSLGDIFDNPDTIQSQDFALPQTGELDASVRSPRARSPTHAVIAHDTTPRARSADDAKHKLEKIKSGEQLNLTRTSKSQLDLHKTDNKQNDYESTPNYTQNEIYNEKNPLIPSMSTTQKLAQEKEEEDSPNTLTPRNGPNEDSEELEKPRSYDLRRVATRERDSPREVLFLLIFFSTCFIKNIQKKTPFQVCLANLSVRVFVGTWNMQGKPPPASGLELFITPHTHDVSSFVPYSPFVRFF
jgi:hypothetical protein